ncbi:MAG: hypothetical protein JRM91_01690 [Nitrososphaerota archaeon]|nr:hypothetical protein [Nitrososphaerota archaeon]MDG6945369.1 hypothetical protein [Nitrososphaerota archaeon]MDG6949111.1 hypothetical protein [Nitrososphaerota archaeon]
MRGPFLGLGVFGIILLLLGTVFALQGDGMIGGSSMTGVPFWIYAGSIIALVGVLMAALGFVLASRGKVGGATTPAQTK